MAHFANTNAELDHDRMDYTLYVNSLAVHLDKWAIEDIFIQYGKITKMFFPDNPLTTWCFISYGFLHEAELAIEELNNKKPLNLKVEFANPPMIKQKSNVKGNFKQSEVINAADSLPIPDDIKHQNMGHSSYKHVMPQIVVPHSVDHGLSSPSCSHTASDIDKSYSNTNQLYWTSTIFH
ncbi:PREDICTED: uncharacterized protein LOC105459265 isoform X1 [Wasmannia auropunctata]|uniref:uncharacterized protein LOC105459265 isoform X1 n=1 Tax=Wasmannia auropunctata TaxID=64793 RepID=UPI0005F06545|nr:PREDICTED: uncharacterized protein LOC105459265 isoform X1 [Wasmannia auropunctata]XP_011703451.1 PREDICTED: uncharacterized protein LOC105459265 isoform X1 [Wasmannia auropunctata]XP_011703452.1 PREDICTED: uncharacterized protein LOC105459265 isoform X1 [Wasmannia auropunctata]